MANQENQSALILYIIKWHKMMGKYTVTSTISTSNPTVKIGLRVKRNDLDHVCNIIEHVFSVNVRTLGYELSSDHHPVRVGGRPISEYLIKISIAIGDFE